MITFDPDSPWEEGQTVTLREDGVVVGVKVVESVDFGVTDETLETQYSLIDRRVWELRQQGVRPWVELG